MAEPVVSTRKTRCYERNKQAPTATKDNTGHVSSIVQLSPKTKNRIAQKAYRDRIKQDEAQYQQHRNYETLRVKAYRATMSAEQRKKYNEKSRLRMKKYREKKKNQGTDIASRPKTRKEKEKQREIWRRNKQLQRLNMSSQKKRRINEKRRKQYALKKQKKAPTGINTESEETNTMPATASSSGYQTESARRKAVSRSIKILPKNPNKFAEVVARIINKSTPRKKAALKDRCIASPSSKKRLDYLESSCRNLKDTLIEIKKKRSKKDNKMRRMLHHMVLTKSKFSATNSLYEQFGLSRNITRRVKRGEDILNKERKKRIDAISEEEVNHIQEFYQKAYVSREMPNMNVVKKDLSVKTILESSLKRTYDQYKNENPEKKISYAKFAQLRPKNVLPMSRQKYMQCLCEYCINIDFKIESLKSFCSVNKINNFATDRYDLSRMTLCPKEGNHYKKECIDRNCGNCGLTKIDDKVIELLENFMETQVGWKRWQQGQKESEVNGKKIIKTFMEMKRRTGTMVQLIDEMKSELSPFSKHLFNAQWQSKQFEDLKAHIPEKWVLMCLDFAENYCCRHQDEAQSAHWTYEQVTIHPLVTYYRCQEENCQQTVRESLVFISEDHKHDHHMVHHCIVKANTYLLEHLDEIRKQIQFSDGAPTQYKSKYNFVDMSYGKDDFGFDTEKHFFGSRHGKGPCDGESGVVKRSATVAVASRGCIISNAQDFYLYAKNQLSLPKENDVEQHIHSKRTFFFIKTGEVNRERPERTLRIKTLKQSRSLFSFRGIQPYVTTARERSCFCHICIGQANGVCQFESLTGNWKVDNLKIRERRPRNQQTGDVNNAPEDADVDVPNEGVGDDLGEGVDDATGDEVGDAPSEGVDALGEGIGDVPGEGVGDDPGEGVDDATGDEVGDAQGEGVGETPNEGVGDATGDEIGDVPCNAVDREAVVVPKHQELVNFELGNQSDDAGSKDVVVPFEFDESFDGMMAVEISFNDSEMSFNNSIEIERLIEVLDHNTDDVEKNIPEKKLLTGLGCNISLVKEVTYGKLMMSVLQFWRRTLLKHWHPQISRCVGAAFVTNSMICRMNTQDSLISNKLMKYIFKLLYPIQLTCARYNCLGIVHQAVLSLKNRRKLQSQTPILILCLK